MIKIAPSILSADFAELGPAVENLEKWGADYIHVDVMDGVFVPKITFGADMVKALRGRTKLPLDVHLMMQKPMDFIDAFAQAGADIITVHAEVEPHLHRAIERIKGHGLLAGAVLNPSTPVGVLECVLAECDMVLLMSVNPGAGGQKFIPSTVQKIAKLRAMANALSHKLDIEVDGGINADTAKACVEAGANVLVAGNSVFGAKDPAQAILALRAAGQIRA